MINAPVATTSDQRLLVRVAEAPAPPSEPTLCGRLTRASLLFAAVRIRLAAVRVRWPSEQPVSYAALALSLLFAGSLYLIPSEAAWMKDEAGALGRMNAAVEGLFFAPLIELIGVVITWLGAFLLVYPRFLEDVGEIVEDDTEDLVASLTPPRSGPCLGRFIATLFMMTLVLPVVLLISLPFFLLHALVATIFTGKTLVAATAVGILNGCLLATSPHAWQFVMFLFGGIGLAALVLFLATLGALSVLHDIKQRREARKEASATLDV